MVGWKQRSSETGRYLSGHDVGPRDTVTGRFISRSTSMDKKKIDLKVNLPEGDKPKSVVPNLPQQNNKGTDYDRAAAGVDAL